MTQRKFWGWGLAAGGPDDAAGRAIAAAVARRFGSAVEELLPVPDAARLELPQPRVTAPAALDAFCRNDALTRASHTYGKSWRDVMRALRGDFSPAPDFVAFPNDEAELAAALDWCAGAGVASIPYGGGSSVVGGVEPAVGPGYRGAVSLDLSRLSRVCEVDRVSRAARIQAGILGPALEDALRPQGLTLRHFPQSFEFSSLGGWIATRAGGHYATLYTHIDDFVESLRVLTPSGVIETRRLPGSGAGPAPERLFLGSEGTLGVITEAWMRLQERPRFRAQVSLRFDGAGGFARGAEVVRRIAQAALFPSNCRLLDATEALTSGAGDGSAALLVLGFESADHPLDARMQRALELCREGGALVPEGAGATHSDDGAPRDAGAASWRSAFLQAPYLRDILARASVISETFETAVTWNRFAELHAAIGEAVQAAARRVCGGATLACRFTHVYPDGPAPYYTVLAPGRRGSELSQWAEIKAAASEAILRCGGTITHHHAVGRDHRAGYDAERPELFARALRAAKRELDPAGILNPGCLFDPAR